MRMVLMMLLIIIASSSSYSLGTLVTFIHMWATP